MINLQDNSVTPFTATSLSHYSDDQAQLLTVVATRRTNFVASFYQQEYKLAVQLVDNQFARSLKDYLLLQGKINGLDFSAYFSQDSLFLLLASHFNDANLKLAPYKVWFAAARAMVEELFAYLRTTYKTSLQLVDLQLTSQGALTYTPESDAKIAPETILRLVMTNSNFSAEMLVVVPTSTASAFSQLLSHCWAPIPLVTKMAAKLKLSFPIVVGNSRLPSSLFSATSSEKLQSGDVLMVQTGPLQANLESLWLNLEGSLLPATIKENQLYLNKAG